MARVLFDEKPTVNSQHAHLTAEKQTVKHGITAVRQHLLINKHNSREYHENKKEWQLEGHIKSINSIDFTAETMCCRYDNTRRLVAVGLANGYIKVYSTESRSIVYSLAPPGKDGSLPVTSLRWKPDTSGQMYDNILLATYSSGFVRTWHVTSGKLLHEHHEDLQKMTCAYNMTGTRYVVGKSDGRIDVHDVETNEILHLMEPSTNTEIMDGHVMRIFSVVYHPTDENLFVSGGWDDTVQWWDTRVSDKYSIKKIVGPHICGEGLDIHPQTSNMLVASWRKDDNFEVYDFGTGKRVTKFESDYENRSMLLVFQDVIVKVQLYCCQWLNRDTVVCGGSHQNSLKYYDVPSREPVAKVYGLSAAVFSVDHDRHHHPIITVCSNKSLHMFEDTI